MLLLCNNASICDALSNSARISTFYPPKLTPRRSSSHGRNPAAGLREGLTGMIGRPIRCGAAAGRGLGLCSKSQCKGLALIVMDFSCLCHIAGPAHPHAGSLRNCDCSGVTRYGAVGGVRLRPRGTWQHCALFALLLPAFAADDDDKGPLAEFYSYLPAAPDIKLPEISIPFWTDDLKKAKRAYKNGNYERAVKLFRNASDDGNVVADWYLGHMYSQGRGVPRDDAMAYSYYSRVADHYDPDEDDQNRLRITVDAMVRIADYQRTGSVNAGLQPDPCQCREELSQDRHCLWPPGRTVLAWRDEHPRRGREAQSAAGHEMADGLRPQALCPGRSLSGRTLLGRQDRPRRPHAGADVVHPRARVGPPRGEPRNLRSRPADRKQCSATTSASRPKPAPRCGTTSTRWTARNPPRTTESYPPRRLLGRERI